MDDQYGMADIRDYMNGRSLLPAFPQPGDLFSGHHRTTPTHQQEQHFEMLMVGRGSSGHQVNSADVVSRGLHHHHQQFRSADSASASTGGVDVNINVLDMEVVGGSCGGDGSGTGRWPRQETLTLLEVRSMLDSKFKEANHKGPLWDEVSRIMSEEYGYQRSGKKCREKFENLYKYYKKTKEGKAGRQDGKHYRFFRQLEALYGDNTTPATTTTSHQFGNNVVYGFQHNQVPNHSEAIQQASLSQSSDLSPCSSDDDDNNTADLDMRRRGRRSWKGKIKDFIELQIKKLMEKQEEWLEKMTKTLERKEQERMIREEEWRKQEDARVEREHKFWANERSWIEARDAALMEALHKFSRRETNASSSEVVTGNNENGSDTITNTWRAEESWLESGLMCKEKWDSINKKRDESYNEQAIYNQARGYGGIGEANNVANSSAGNGLHDSCFRFFVGAEEPNNLWDSYGSKNLNKDS